MLASLSFNFPHVPLFPLSCCGLNYREREREREASMDVRTPCNWSLCTPICRKPVYFRQFSLPEKKRYLRNLTKSRGVTMAELQMPVGISDRAGSDSPSIPTHKVTVYDRQRGIVHEFLVPEDQYILHTAESHNISLPFACRHGCCTSCAVRIKSGQIRQPEALGISAELKSKGYALLCVGFPSSDIEVETQDEDEVYWLQFGRYFARGPIDRDDYALELAMGDE